MDVIGQRQINSTGLSRCFSYPHHFPPRRVCVLKLSNIRLKKMCSFTLHLTAAAFFFFFALKVQTGFFFFLPGSKHVANSANVHRRYLIFHWLSLLSPPTEVTEPGADSCLWAAEETQRCNTVASIRSPPYKCASSLRQLSLATKNANGALS